MTEQFATDDTTDDTAPAADGEDTGDTFTRDYVEGLRRENAGYRDRAKSAEARAEELARQLFTARVAATGKLADATDLTYSGDLLDDADALTAAIDDLLSSKPHLKARKVSGEIGQGQRGDSVEGPTDFGSLFR